jgi:biotin carboxyl carrier protein
MSSGRDHIELEAQRDGDDTLLLSPGVGWFTLSAHKGALLVPGNEVGRLRTLGVSAVLVVPPGVSGRVVNDPPRALLDPVDYRRVLYRLAPIAADQAAGPDGDADDEAAGGMLLRAPHAGRFWHRAAPSEPPMLSVGDAISEGQAVGLIEVMKTFSLVPYRAKGGLPARARIVRIVASDGAEVDEGSPLAEVEPA